MTQHTPGPWHVMPNGLCVGDKKVWIDEAGARFGETPNILIDCPTEGDARLIASAPELLAALKDMLAEFDDPTVTDDIKTQVGWSANTIKALQRSRAAISKATA